MPPRHPRKSTPRRRRPGSPPTAKTSGAGGQRLAALGVRPTWEPLTAQPSTRNATIEGLILGLGRARYAALIDWANTGATRLIGIFWHRGQAVGSPLADPAAWAIEHVNFFINNVFRTIFDLVIDGCIHQSERFTPAPEALSAVAAVRDILRRAEDLRQAGLDPKAIEIETRRVCLGNALLSMNIFLGAHRRHDATPVCSVASQVPHARPTPRADTASTAMGLRRPTCFAGVHGGSRFRS